MPIVNLTVKKGCSDAALADCMKALTDAIASNLENTLPRMIRVSVTEVPDNRVVQGEQKVEHCIPTAVFQLGPGRSDVAIEKCMQAMVNAIHLTLDVPKDDVRVYITAVEGDHFAIGGKAKDFSIKVG